MRDVRQKSKFHLSNYLFLGRKQIENKNMKKEKKRRPKLCAYCQAITKNVPFVYIKRNYKGKKTIKSLRKYGTHRCCYSNTIKHKNKNV